MLPAFDSEEAKAFLAQKTSLSQLLLPWSVALLAFLLMGWAWFSEIDIVSSSRGVIIPDTHLQFIQSSGTNVVQSIRVKEGQRVAKGDVLVTFRQQTEQDEAENIQEALKKNQAKIARLRQLVAFYHHREPEIDPLLSNTYLDRERVILEHQKRVHHSEEAALAKKISTLSANRQGLQHEIELLQALQPRTEAEIERMQSLLEEGIVQQQQLDELTEKRIRQAKELEIKSASQVGIEGEIAYLLETHHQTVENRLQEIESELLILEQENRVQELDLSKLESEICLKNLEAPIDGIVNKIMIHTLGAVVQSGESILSLVPEKSPLEIEAKILNQDVGFIEVGQTVSIKLDSFNFTKYGKLNGVIRQIASGAVEDPQLGMVYPTLIELTSQQIELNDRVFRLRPGMTVTIDITTGRRRIADYILEPFLRYGDEALRER